MARRRPATAQQVSRPKRRATNAHVLRYLQTRNPSKLENSDLKRALEASLEEYPDFWPEEPEREKSPSGSISSSSASSSSKTNNHHLNQYHQNYTYRPNHNKYKPVAKKNIYKEADFFHDGIMEYIMYELESERRAQIQGSKNETK